ncbi:hypothetical protein [Sphingobium lactosutens]|uniref:hypothetical protein n=1 Tax=Sphingobium lactosutens TaxID=522773 RepID=UPI002117DBBB|nr:hypothetical protein [Sphingobium lactosutens]
MQTRRATALSDSASASLLVNGKLLKLPAGNMGVNLRFSGDTSALRSTSEEAGLASTRTARRTNGGAQISIDVPITSRRNGFLSALGTLTANANASVTQYSDYGALGTFGYGLSWTPRTGISFIAAINNDRSAPTLEERNAPTITTSNVRIYDYVRSESATVTQVSGGNQDLRADNRHQLKLGATVKPWSKRNLSLSANYVSSRTRNAIIDLSGAAPALEEAFPDRYERDEDGTLIRINSRPVNVAREDREQFRWGINFTSVLRAPRRPTPPPGFAPPPGLDGASPPDDADILVTGRRGEDGAPMPPPGGPPGGGRGGPGGMGPPPPGGPGGGPFGGGSDNGARLQFSLYHSMVLRNAVLLREGSNWIDLLDGGTLGGTAQSRHSVQLSSGIIDNGVGLRIDSNWKSSAHVSGDQSQAGSDLRFGSLLTFDLRLFANMANRFRGQIWARGMRVSLSVENMLNSRQTVTDASGATPLAYQKAYLDPEGRTVLLTLRKIL